MTAVIYLLCGLSGAGKTTRANQLEEEGAGILLNADRWVHHFYPDDSEAAARDHRKGLVEQMQWQVAEQLLRSGANVILDWGLWTRAERDLFRIRASEVGASAQLLFVDAPLETLHRRVAERNLDLPHGTFRVSPVELDEWATLFEPRLMRS